MTLEQKRKYHREYMRKYYWLNVERCRESKRKSAARYSEKNVERVRKWRIKNRERWLATLRKHYVLNRERICAKNRKFFDKFKQRLRNYKRRARKMDGEIQDCFEKIGLLRKERFCRWCCNYLTSDNFTIDHIIPIARGGNHVPDNLAASCRRCNFSRGDKLIHEWLPQEVFE